MRITVKAAGRNVRKCVTQSASKLPVAHVDGTVALDPQPPVAVFPDQRPLHSDQWPFASFVVEINVQ